MQFIKLRPRFSAVHRLGIVLILASAFVLVCSSLSQAMISVGPMSKEQAKEKYGITMHARKNGDAGIMVWLEFKKVGWLEKFTYADLELIDDKGMQVLSARLQPNPVRHDQKHDVTTVGFSAQGSQLPNCRFLVVCYRSNEGDVGRTLSVKDFLDMKNPVTE